MSETFFRKFGVTSRSHKPRLAVALCAFVTGLLIGSVPLSASAKSFMDVGKLNNVDFGTWENSGSWSTTLMNCIGSATDRNPKAGSLTLPYNARVRNRDQNDGFYLYLDGNDNATGNERILISFAHRDLLSLPFGYETLANDQYDFHLHSGQYNKCPSGDNSELRIDVNGSELASKVNGTYTGRFEFGARNIDNDDKTNFDVQITVARGTEVRISNLDPVNFGQHSGVGNLAANERFCVYSNSASGSYRLSVSATSQDGSGNFFLEETSTAELIPMTVFISDSPVGTATFPMLNNYFSGIGDNDRDDCRGNDNATLSLFMNEADLQAASTGNYSETLIILVEPE